MNLKSIDVLKRILEYALQNIFKYAVQIDCHQSELEFIQL